MKMTIVLLVVMGLVAGICAVVLVNYMKGGFSRSEVEVMVAVATRNLPEGTHLTKDNVKDNVKMEAVPLDQLASNKYMTNLALVVNRTLSDDITIEGVLYSYNFESGGSIRERIAELEDGMRVISVSLTSSQVNGDLLYPGCIVDVLASFRLPGNSKDNKGQAVSVTLLEDVEVFAIEGRLEDVEDKDRGTSRSARSAGVEYRTDSETAGGSG